MENKQIILINEATKTKPVHNNLQKFNLLDELELFASIYPVEISKINDKENTITFKFLNPNEEIKEETIPISEYLDLLKKYFYLYNKCSLCNKKQNGKYNSIFSYCTKCDTIICSDCIDKHLKTNKKNHHNLKKENIIRNNEKNTKCLLHPNRKNLAFSLKC